MTCDTMGAQSMNDGNFSVKMRLSVPSSRTPAVSRACSVVQVLVGRWAGRMSGKYPTLQTGGGGGGGGGGGVRC